MESYYSYLIWITSHSTGEWKLKRGWSLGNTSVRLKTGGRRANCMQTEWSANRTCVQLGWPAYRCWPTHVWKKGKGFAFEMFPSLVKNEGFKLARKRLIGCGRLVDCWAKCSFADVSLFAFMGSSLLLLSLLPIYPAEVVRVVPRERYRVQPPANGGSWSDLSLDLPCRDEKGESSDNPIRDPSVV